MGGGRPADDDVRIFVSYSHEDGRLVAQLVKLLRAMERSVFRDEDGIAPGTRWRDELVSSIEAASHLVVFWCQHAAASSYVASEVDLAAQDAHKRVIPVLLDGTPLSRVLTEYQAIDLREAAERTHGAVWRRGRLLLAACAVLAVVGLGVGVARWLVPPAGPPQPVPLYELLQDPTFVLAGRPGDVPRVAFDADPDGAWVRLRPLVPEQGPDLAAIASALGGGASCAAEAPGSEWVRCHAEAGFAFVIPGAPDVASEQMPIDLARSLPARMVPIGSVFEVREEEAEPGGRFSIRALGSDRDALLAALSLSLPLSCRPEAVRSEWLTCAVERGYFAAFAPPGVAGAIPFTSWERARAWLGAGAAAAGLCAMLWRSRRRRLAYLARSLAGSVARVTRTASA